jgi:hypothetical protein
MQCIVGLSLSEQLAVKAWICKPDAGIGSCHETEAKKCEQRRQAKIENPTGALARGTEPKRETPGGGENNQRPSERIGALRDRRNGAWATQIECG